MTNSDAITFVGIVAKRHNHIVVLANISSHVFQSKRFSSVSVFRKHPHCKQTN